MDNTDIETIKKSYDPYIAAGIILWLLFKGISIASASELSNKVKELQKPLISKIVSDNENTSETKMDSLSVNPDINHIYIQYPGLEVYTSIKESVNNLNTVIQKSQSSSNKTITYNEIVPGLETIAGTIQLSLPKYTLDIKNIIDSRVTGRNYKFTYQANNITLLGELQNNGYPVSKVDITKINEVFSNEVLYANFNIDIYLDNNKIQELNTSIAEQYYLVKNYILDNYGFSEPHLRAILKNKIWDHNLRENLKTLHNNRFIQFM